MERSGPRLSSRRGPDIRRTAGWDAALGAGSGGNSGALTAVAHAAITRAAVGREYRVSENKQEAPDDSLPCPSLPASFGGLVRSQRSLGEGRDISRTGVTTPGRERREPARVTETATGVEGRLPVLLH